MDFDNLNFDQKTTIWNRLYELVLQKQKTEERLSSLRKEQKEFEEKLKSTSGCGGLILLFIIFSGTPAILTVVFGIVTSDKKTLRFIEGIWNYKEFVILVLLIITIALLIVRIIHLTKRSKIKKQLSKHNNSIKHFETEKDSIDLEIETICEQYNIPKSVITKKCILYIKDLVETKHFDYNTAFSLCIKNKEKINRPSLSEISKKFPLRGSNNQYGLEFAIAFPFKIAGAFLGIDKESIKRAQRIKYNQPISTNSRSDAISEFGDEQSKYTFIDGNGNLIESGNMFYDGKGNPCEWGQPFYDGKGNYIEWGDPFYDSKGNYCVYGQPFYDSKGNLINPK